MSNPRQAFTAAVAQHRAGRLDDAAKLYEQVLARVPNQVDSLHLLGVLATQRADYKTAVELISRAIEKKKASPVAEFHNNIGAAYKGLGQRKDAANHFRLAARLKPSYAEAFNNLGAVLEEDGELEEARKNFRQALALKPDYAKAHCGCGNVALAQGKPADALACYEQALAIDPNYLEAHSNLGRALIDLGKFDDAEARFCRILSLDPDYAPAHYNLGVALEEQGAPDKAKASYQKALSLSPDEPDYRWNAALLHLLKGDYAAGWAEYEWRLRRARKLTRDVGQPRWDGSDPSGQTILIQTEQGFGDTFQFIRYAQLVNERGGKVIVECQPGTEPLLPLAVGVDAVVSRDNSLPRFDRYIELLSLPHSFSTTLKSIPAQVPYMSAPLDLIEAWRRRANATSGVKTGLVWRGNPQNTINPKKSIPIDDVAKLCALEGVSWFSIQLDAGRDEIDALRACTPIEVCGPLLTDWAETAALISVLDLVITVDTGVAHLAGALGKPVWIVLSHIPDWRWMLEREDTPWYPTARLFRQRSPGDWGDVTARVRETLAVRVAQGR